MVTDLTMWWPHPDSFQDLEVTENEEGWQLSAPDETELGAWLSYWSQDEEHHTFFEQEFIQTLLNHADFTLGKHGEDQILPDGDQSNREKAQVLSSGLLTEHEPGSYSQPPQA